MSTSSDVHTESRGPWLGRRGLPFLASPPPHLPSPKVSYFGAVSTIKPFHRCHQYSNSAGKVNREPLQCVCRCDVWSHKHKGTRTAKRFLKFSFHWCTFYFCIVLVCGNCLSCMNVG